MCSGKSFVKYKQEKPALLSRCSYVSFVRFRNIVFRFCQVPVTYSFTPSKVQIKLKEKHTLILPQKKPTENK